MTPEKRIEYEILSFLSQIGIFAWKVDRAGTYDPVRKTFRANHNPYKIKGVSDIHGIIAGRFIAIEVKSKTGKLTPEQRVFLAKVGNEGGISFVARSLDQCISQLLQFLPENEKLKRYAKAYEAPRETDH
jgi:penicillin-binding protein-related factor A (putative recombinase)